MTSCVRRVLGVRPTLRPRSSGDAARVGHDAVAQQPPVQEVRAQGKTGAYYNANECSSP